MITKKFLKEQLSRLQTNFGKEKFDLSLDKFDLWYEMFSDCNEEGLKIAVTNCIIESEYAPNIAGLMKFYKALEQERTEVIETMTSKYKTLLSQWGEKYDKDTFKAIADYIYRFPKAQRKVQMVEMTHHAITFYNDCVSVGRKDIPTIKEYVEGKR